MKSKHGSLSPQELKRLQGGELILKGYDNHKGHKDSQSTKGLLARHFLAKALIHLFLHIFLTKVRLFCA